MHFAVLPDDCLTEQSGVVQHGEPYLPEWLSLHSRMFVSRVLAGGPPVLFP